MYQVNASCPVATRASTQPDSARSWVSSMLAQMATMAVLAPASTKFGVGGRGEVCSQYDASTCSVSTTSGAWTASRPRDSAITVTAAPAAKSSRRTRGSARGWRPSHMPTNRKANHGNTG